MTKIALKFRSFLSSNTFAWLIIGLFILQAAWIALSAVYPQAFDEEFHFGIIKAYSHYWLPFLSGQPDHANAYGAVARDPSFLYHYLMSFPYRLSTLLVHAEAAQVIFLRLLNVGMMAFGLVLFRKLLLRAGLGKRPANLIIFIVSLIPVVPQLAGQINYDNLVVPMTAWACLLTLSLVDEIKSRQVSSRTFIGLLTVCLLASMVKYEFVPIFAAIVLFVGVLLLKAYRAGELPVKATLAEWQRTLPKQWPLLLVALVAVVMFVQRDVVNVLAYHDIAPNCAHILTKEQCSEYSVWYHDYTSHQQVLSGSAYVSPNPFWYLGEWFYWLWYRLFFAINGPYHTYANYPPLPLPAAAFALLVLASVVALIAGRRAVFKGKPYLAFFGVVTVVYLLALLSQGYLKYRETGVLELMNGRYLLPIMVPAAVVGYAALRRYAAKQAAVQVAVAAVVVVCFLQGGGVLTFISRSDNTWYWQNSAVQNANNTARAVLRPLILEGPKTFRTRKWFFN